MLYWLNHTLPNDRSIPNVAESAHKRVPARCLAATTNAAVGGIRAFSTPVNDSFAPISTTPPPAPEAQGAVWRAVNARAPRYDWTKDEIRELYNTPLMELAHQAVCLCLVVDARICVSWLLSRLLTWCHCRVCCIGASTLHQPCKCAR